MGLSSAMNVSLNGLRLNETKIDVLGNNIANADTAGFKASSVLFQTQLFRTTNVGSAPSPVSGGTNPLQLGLGARVAAINKDFGQGSVSTTTSPSDLAIQGDGFFIVNAPSGNTFTRAGQFRLNNQNQLVDPGGLLVQGYGVDEDFNVNFNTLDNIEVPLGELVNTAKQTTTVEMTGALLPFAKNDAPIEASIVELGAGITGTTSAGFGDGAGGTATTTTLLSDLDSGGTGMFAVGDVIDFSPVKGTRTLPTKEFTVTATSDVADFMAFIEDTAGIPDGAASLTAGVIQVSGQAGELNDLEINPSSFNVTSGAVTNPITGLSSLETQQAGGEAVAVDFVVYDSLGERLNVKLTAALNEAATPDADGNSVFDWYVETPDTTGVDRLVGTGQLTFDEEGVIVTASNSAFTIERANTAAATPMVVDLDFSTVFGVSDETSAQSSTMSLKNQNGSSAGTLVTYAIDDGGVITGILDNSEVITLGQLALARFRNQDGLIEVGGSRFSAGAASGEPVIVTPGSFGAGTILAGSIENSNTDIGKSLVDLIVASTNYRGNARVINSVQELVDELLVLGR